MAHVHGGIVLTLLHEITQTRNARQSMKPQTHLQNSTIFYVT